MSLLKLQQSFQTFLFENIKTIEQDIAEPVLGSIESRLAIYGNGYQARLEEILANDYPTLLSLLGEDKFYELTTPYIQANPSIYFSADFYGEKFPEFLKNIDPLYTEIAIFEWAESTAIIAANTKILMLEEMQKIPLDNWPLLIFNLHPSLQVLIQQWNSLKIIEQLRLEKKPPKAKLLPTPLTVMVWRNGLSIQYCALDAVEAKLIKAIQQKNTFAELCELLCEDLPENEVANYIVNKFLIYLERKLLLS